MKILLKVNALIAKPPERAATTHPAVLKAVIQWVKQFNPNQIIVADSGGGITMGQTEKNLKASGIQGVCDDEGVICTSFEKSKSEIFHVEQPLVLNEITASNLLKEVDLIINLPKIKTHNQMRLTCCIKNMFGILLLGNKPKTHAQFTTLDKFASALVDIYSVTKPQLTLIDGYLCQEGSGPSAGDVVKMDLILAGYDPVALDTSVCEIIGMDPKSILYLPKAEMKGLGTMDLSKITYTNAKPRDVYRQFKPPKMGIISIPLPKKVTESIANIVFKADISFDKTRCKTCGTCWKNCPVLAISPPSEIKIGNVPTWNRQKCITCYCCGELCQYEAVQIKVNIPKNIFTSWLGIALIGGIGIAIWLLSLIINAF